MGFGVWIAFSLVEVFQLATYYDDFMIKTVDLRVDYDDMTAVKDLNLEVRGGEVFGLIGPNGAGKTSTIRVISTLQKPTYGDVYVGGFDVIEDAPEVHKILGYMPDFAPVYEELKLWEFLDMFAGTYFVERKKRKRRVAECLDIVNLLGKRDLLAGSLSRGMTQRLVLAKTLLPDPMVMVLDEPASGLDFLARIDMRNLLKRLGQMGKAVMISSHILTELSGVCSSIGIMNHGRMIECGRVDEIAKKLSKDRGKVVVVSILGGRERKVELIRKYPSVVDVQYEQGEFVISLDGDDREMSLFLKYLVNADVMVKSFGEQKMDIETIAVALGGYQS